jgi:hypothetical protein
MIVTTPCFCGSLCLGSEISPDSTHHRDTKIAQRHRETRLFRGVLILPLLLAFTVTSYPQNESKRKDRPQSNSTSTIVPDSKQATSVRYRWEFSQREFLIKHIVVEHDVTGRGKVTFARKGEEEPIVENVELTPSVLERIEKLWRELRFLDSNENYQASKNFAHLGTYKLGMTALDRKRTAEFNWSSNASAWSLAQEYRRVADQVIFIFDITIARENQPLNTPGLLKQLESMYNRNARSDPKQLIPLLKEIRTDAHIPLIARNHAERLLKKFEK